MNRLTIPLVLLLAACQAPTSPALPEPSAPPAPPVARPPSTTPATSDSPRPTRPAKWRPTAASVRIQFAGDLSWALRGHDVALSAGHIHNSTESMIKAWLAVDYLATHGSKLSPGEEQDLELMLQRSDDNVAERFYRALGRDLSVHRMIKTCGLADTEITSSWWSLTRVSAMDAARLGECVAAGPGLSAARRDKLLSIMRTVAPDNRFGIPEAPTLAGEPLAIKNGWTRHGDTWAVNCLAVWNGWSLAVLTRYDARHGDHRYGARTCKLVAEQLFVNSREQSTPGT